MITNNHILIKRCVGYHLFEEPLDHTTLNRFEMWVFRHCPRLFFDEVIRLIDELCPEDRARIQKVFMHKVRVDTGPQPPISRRNFPLR